MGKTKLKLLRATNNLVKARELVMLMEGVPFIITTPQEEGITRTSEGSGPAQ